MTHVADIIAALVLVCMAVKKEKKEEEIEHKKRSEGI